MREKQISFETAKLAKEKGFDWDCYHAYDKDTKLKECSYTKDKSKVQRFTHSLCAMLNRMGHTNVCLVPTQSLLQKWLREKHNIIVFVSPLIPACEEFGCTIYKRIIREDETETIEFTIGFQQSYEKALEEGLQEALKLINNE